MTHWMTYFMENRRRLLISRFLPVLAFLFVLIPPVRAQNDLPKDQLDAYVAMIQADRARDKGDYKTAVQGYREALLRYRNLSQANPSWHPDIVEYRLTYCANEIEAILRQVDKTEEQLVEEETVADGDELARLRALYSEALKAQASLQADLESAKNASRSAAKDLARREEDLARAKGDLARLKDQLASSTNTIQAANQLAANALAGMETENRHLKAELAAQVDAMALAVEAQNRLKAELQALTEADARLRVEMSEAKAFAESLQSKAAEDARIAQDAKAALASVEERAAKAEAAIEKEREDAAKAGETLKSVRADAREANARIKELTAQLEAAQVELATQRTEGERLSALLAEKDTQKASSDQALQAADAVRSSLQVERDAMEKALADARMLSKQYETDLTNLKRELEAAQAAARDADARAEGGAAELQRLTAAAAGHVEALAAMERRALDAEAALSQQQAELGVARDELKQLGDAGRETQTLRDEVARLRNERQLADEALASLRKEIEESGNAAKAWQAEEGKLKNELLARDAALAKADERAVVAEAGAKNAAEELKALREETKSLRSLKDDREKLSKELDDVKARLEGSIDDIAEKERLHAALLDNHEAVLKRMQDTANELATVEALAKEASGERDALRGDVKNLNDQMNVLVKQRDETLAQAEGEILRLRSELAEAGKVRDALAEANARLEALESDHRETLKDLDAVREDLVREQQAKRVAKLEALITELREEIKALKKKIRNPPEQSDQADQPSP